MWGPIDVAGGCSVPMRHSGPTVATRGEGTKRTSEHSHGAAGPTLRHERPQVQALERKVQVQALGPAAVAEPPVACLGGAVLAGGSETE